MVWYNNRRVNFFRLYHSPKRLREKNTERAPGSGGNLVHVVNDPMGWMKNLKTAKKIMLLTTGIRQLISTNLKFFAFCPNT